MTETLAATLWRKYPQADKEDKAAELAIAKVSQLVEDSLSQVCLICLENVNVEDPIWSCTQCFNSLHLPCIQKWIRSSMAQAFLQSTDSAATVRSQPWQCPKCRQDFEQSEVPSQYLCYCGKERDPPVNGWLAPHSCGARCDKPLQPLCGHTCILLCHPGPCPPCPVTVKSPCYCQRTSSMRRCGNKLFGCGAKCDRKLNCGTHHCSSPCHSGPCSLCDKSSLQHCRCGRNQAMVPCFKSEWQCDQICGKTLSCSHHSCQRVCHSGACGDCPRNGSRPCPCGATNFYLPCTEEVSTCKNTCQKLLSCGIHNCIRPCHRGDCGSCMLSTSLRCQCGQTVKDGLCGSLFLCDKRCNNDRTCGRHKCRRKCCTGVCPPCPEVCGRMLGCGTHRCEAPCHKGACFPCREQTTISCSCGMTTVTVPCGAHRAMAPPRCTKQCSFPPYCRHDTQQVHLCHANDCPTCTQVCKQPLSCGHECTAQCHDEKPPPQPNRGRKRAQTTRPIAIPTPCPPCNAPVTKDCAGGHQTVTLPCSKASSFKCTHKCGRNLPCGNHVCERECHGPVLTKPKASYCGQCTQRCTKQRPNCNHACVKGSCHIGACPPCEQLVPKRCHCNGVTLQLECVKISTASEEAVDGMLSCGVQCTREMPCSHLCTFRCHSGPCSSPSDCLKKAICTCECGRIKQEFVCREVFGKPSSVHCDENCDLVKERRQAALRQRQTEKIVIAPAPEEPKPQKLVFGRQKYRKPRNKDSDGDDQDEITFWQQWRLAILLAAALVCVIAIVFFLLR